MATLRSTIKATLDNNADERYLADKLTEVAEYHCLKAQYKLLSELEECFGKKSKHEGAIYVDKKMRELLSRIDKLEV